MELSRENSLAYFDVMDKLNVLHAHLFPKVTDNIAAIIASIEELIVKGHAYETSTGVYFEVKSWGEYGKLSGRTEADAMAGARVEVDPEKRDPAISLCGSFKRRARSTGKARGDAAGPAGISNVPR